MSKRFTKVYGEALWRSKRFRAASRNGKLLYLYLLTSGHQTSIGAFTLPDQYAVADLGWEIEEYRETRNELEASGLIGFDADTEEVYVCTWFRHSPPQNEKHAQGCQRLINDLESSMLCELVQQEFDDANQARLASRNPIDDPKVSTALLNSRLLNGRGW